MRNAMISLLILAVLGLPQVARSAPILALDVDPGSAGIQSTRTLSPGDVVTVDVVIDDVEAGASLNGFELDVDFASSVLSATSVVDGGFLLPVRLAFEMNLAAPDVNFAEVTLAGGGAIGGGVLARITFEAIGLGTSALSLNDVILTSVLRPGVVVTLPREVETAEASPVERLSKAAGVESKSDRSLASGRRLFHLMRRAD